LMVKGLSKVYYLLGFSGLMPHIKFTFTMEAKISSERKPEK